MRTFHVACEESALLAITASMGFKPSDAPAATNVWMTGGPVNGAFQSLAIDPSTPATECAANHTYGIFAPDQLRF